MTMMLRLSFVSFALLAANALLGQEPTKSSVVKKAAAELVDATERKDFAKVIDHTYPEVVKVFGGRDRAIKLVETAASGLKDQLKANGITRTEMKVGEPGEFHTAGESTFVVVPTVLEMSFAGGKLRSKSFMLGISSDDGKTWKFVDGGGLADAKFRERVLPKLPDKLVLRKPEKSELLKDR